MKRLIKICVIIILCLFANQSYSQKDSAIFCNKLFDFDLGFIYDSLASQTEPYFFNPYLLKKEELHFNFESTFEFYLFKMPNSEYIAYSHLPTGYPNGYGITVEYGLKKRINKKYKFNRIKRIRNLKTNSGVYLGMTINQFMVLKGIDSSSLRVDGKYTIYTQYCGYKTHLGNMEEYKFYSNQNKFTFKDGKLICINIGNYPYIDLSGNREKYIVFDK